MRKDIINLMKKRKELLLDTLDGYGDFGYYDDSDIYIESVMDEVEMLDVMLDMYECLGVNKGY